jgi:hypothetical protein
VGFALLEVAVPSLLEDWPEERAGGLGMSPVVIGMDPHRRSATIEVMAGDEAVVGGGR